MHFSLLSPQSLAPFLPCFSDHWFLFTPKPTSRSRSYLPFLWTRKLVFLNSQNILFFLQLLSYFPYNNLIMTLLCSNIFKGFPFTKTGSPKFQAQYFRPRIVWSCSSFATLALPVFLQAHTASAKMPLPHLGFFSSCFLCLKTLPPIPPSVLLKITRPHSSLTWSM